MGLLVPGLPLCPGGALVSLAAGPLLFEVMRHGSVVAESLPGLQASESTWFAWAWARFLVRAVPLLVYARWIALAAGADPGQEEGGAAPAGEPVRGPR